MKLLLDTCTFIWLTSAPDRLGASASSAIDRADEIFLSDVSVLEIGLKWQAGKLTLPAPPRFWLPEQSRVWRLTPLPLGRDHILRSTELPDIHRDPFDRLLVAQSLEEGLPIATPDEAIRRYPVATMW